MALVPPAEPSPYLQPMASHLPTPTAVTITSTARECEDKAEDDDAVTYVPGTRLPTKYLDMKFESCFYQHKSNESTDCNLYPCLASLFQCTKLCVYACFVFYLGIILTFIWGMIYGTVAFSITYVWSPIMHLFIICVNMAAPIISVPLQGCLGPLCFCWRRRDHAAKPA